MSYCIYDRSDRCTFDCEGCKAYKFRCAECGNDAVSYLYDNCGELLCADCFMEETKEDFYEDFAAEYSAEFYDYFIRANEALRVPAQLQ